MKISSRFRSVAVAVIAAAGASFASAAHADSGTIRFAVYSFSEKPTASDSLPSLPSKRQSIDPPWIISTPLA